MTKKRPPQALNTLAAAEVKNGIVSVATVPRARNARRG